MDATRGALAETECGSGPLAPDLGNTSVGKWLAARIDPPTAPFFPLLASTLKEAG